MDEETRQTLGPVSFRATRSDWSCFVASSCLLRSPLRSPLRSSLRSSFGLHVGVHHHSYHCRPSSFSLPGYKTQDLLAMPTEYESHLIL